MNDSKKVLLFLIQQQGWIDTWQTCRNLFTLIDSVLFTWYSAGYNVFSHQIDSTPLTFLSFISLVTLLARIVTAQVHTEWSRRNCHKDVVTSNWASCSQFVREHCVILYHVILCEINPLKLVAGGEGDVKGAFCLNQFEWAVPSLVLCSAQSNIHKSTY